MSEKREPRPQMPDMSATRSNSRDTILTVSVKLFAKHGFEGVAMRQIANEANITLPAIYHHFGNKEALFRAVEAELYTSHASSLLDALHADAEPIDKLRNFIENLIGNLVKDPDYLKLLQRNLVEGWTDNHKFLVDMSLQGVFDELKSLLDECAPAGGQGIQPLFIFASIIGYLTLRPVTRELRGHDFASETESIQLAELVEQIITIVTVKRVSEVDR
jgi:TetR/AcrR family transcriptional regulator